VTAEEKTPCVTKVGGAEMHSSKVKYNQTIMASIALVTRMGAMACLMAGDEAEVTEDAMVSAEAQMVLGSCVLIF
jgi:hypothetical protein